MALEPAKLSDFQIAGSIGAGTTARVYEAVHTATGRPVAIKTLEPSQSGSEMRERFAREALLLANVDSRFVGKILGFGFDKGQPFLVLERLTGETLDAKLRRDGPPPMPLAVRWVEQLLVGVRDCHAAQVIHRDIKPSNIFLHHDGFEESVKLIDFGVARLKEITTGDPGGLTSTNHLIGSMGYMAPEQFRNAKTVDFSADLYAVGVVVFRTLTGRLPFVSRSLEAVIRMKTEQSPPSLSSLTGMPKNVLLDWFVQKAMAREPRERFQSAREMLEHWWNVMSSLDEEATTDVMRGIGRVDESYAGPLHKAKQESMIPVSVGPVSDSEEFTVKRAALAPIAVPQVQGVPPTMASPQPIAPPEAESSPRTERIPFTPPLIHEAAPPSAPPLLNQDGWDIPTKSDPNLRKLVERELELHRKKKDDT